MKPEQQIKALAEVDGWTQQTLWSPCDICQCDPREGHWIDTPVPNYLTSYDAIIPLIQKQSPLVLTQFVDFLCSDLLYDHYDGSDYISQPDIGQLFRASPFQLCEALLRATNKWYDC